MRESKIGDLYLHSADEVMAKVADLGLTSKDMRSTEVEEDDGTEPGAQPYVAQVSTRDKFAFFVEGQSEAAVTDMLEQVGIEITTDDD